MSPQTHPPVTHGAEAELLCDLARRHGVGQVLYRRKGKRQAEGEREKEREVESFVSQRDSERIKAQMERGASKDREEGTERKGQMERPERKTKRGRKREREKDTEKVQRKEDRTEVSLFSFSSAFVCLWSFDLDLCSRHSYRKNVSVFTPHHLRQCRCLAVDRTCLFAKTRTMASRRSSSESYTK